MHSGSLDHRAFCCRYIYHRGLLVHRVHVLREPAVTLARAASDTFAGIRPHDAPAFIAAQLAGATTATLLFRWLLPSLLAHAPDMLVAHDHNS